MNSGEEVGSKIYSRKQSLRRGDSSFFLSLSSVPGGNVLLSFKCDSPRRGGSVLVGKILRHTKKIADAVSGMRLECQRCACRTKLLCVSAARFTSEKPANESNSISRFGPAWGPKPRPTGCALEAGTQIKVPNP